MERDRSESDLGDEKRLAIDPIYTTPTPNAEIEVYRGPATLKIDTRALEGETRIWLKWVPSPVFRFEVNLPQAPEDDRAYFDGDPVLVLAPHSESTKVLVLGNKDGRYHGVLNGSLETGDFEKVDQVVFHVPNFFCTFPGRGLLNRKGEFTRGIDTAAEGRVIHLDHLVGAHEIQDQAKKEGGFAITHAGAIRSSVRGGTLDKSACLDHLHRFFFALSFARGGWSPPLLLVGLDGAGAPCWQRWDMRIVSRRAGAESSWASISMRLDAAIDQIDWFLKKSWAVGHRVIAWYIDASQGSLSESSLIKTFVALEMLAWHATVNSSRALTENGFKSLPAADALRVALALHRIDPKVPDAFKELDQFARSDCARPDSPPDGPEALMVLRNSIVHAGKKASDRLSRASDRCIYEAKELGLYYAELLLLAMAGYSGEFVDRTQHCAMQVVPWADRT
jgi:hypothetical protein